MTFRDVIEWVLSTKISTAFIGMLSGLAIWILFALLRSIYYKVPDSLKVVYILGSWLGFVVLVMTIYCKHRYG